MLPLQNCIGPTIRIGREILCLPYAGFFDIISPCRNNLSWKLTLNQQAYASGVKFHFYIATKKRFLIWDYLPQ